VPQRGAAGTCTRCHTCEQIAIACNSCRNRHCPKRQASAARRWLEARQAALLPLDYYRVVFTLPAPISAIAYYNKAVIYDLLFEVAAETLRTLASDPRRSRPAEQSRGNARYPFSVNSTISQLASACPIKIEKKVP
jgi:hypothetical protein